MFACSRQCVALAFFHGSPSFLPSQPPTYLRLRVSAWPYVAPRDLAAATLTYFSSRLPPLPRSDPRGPRHPTNSICNTYPLVLTHFSSVGPIFLRSSSAERVRGYVSTTVESNCFSLYKRTRNSVSFTPPSPFYPFYPFSRV